MVTPSSWTRAARAGLDTDSGRGAVVPPVYLSTNYTFTAPGEPRAHDYSRAGNPTRDVLQDALAELERAAGCVAVASGMAAVTLAIEALVPVGGRVVAPLDAYGGTWRLGTWLAERGRIELDLVALSDLDAAREALARPADLVWVETPSNPLLRITDIAAVADLAHSAGALLAVDNTLSTPLLQRPLALGADLVVHSTTKFVAGHSDVIGGACLARDEAVADELAGWANTLGLTAAAFDSYLVMRGLRSLDARLRVHAENALAVAHALEAHPAVRAVHFPALPQHPDHALAARQMAGPGSLIAFEVDGGLAGVEAFLDGLEIFHLAESLGGVESLVCHPATMTHAAMSPEALAAAGVGDGLLRLSVGLERDADLVAAVREGLDRVSTRC